MTMEMALHNQSKQLFGAAIILLGAIFMVFSLIILQQDINESAINWAMVSQFQLSEDNELRTWWPIAIIGIGVFLLLSPKKNSKKKITTKSTQEKIKISNK